MGDKLNGQISDDFLAPGRHRWTMEQVAEKYCPPADYGITHRQEVWSHFQQTTSWLRSVVPVAAVWIGGSFLSSKEKPSDVDAVYIVRAKEYDQLQDEQAKQTVGLFAGGGVFKQKGLCVDSYVLPWRPRPSNGPETDRDHIELANRGYWDDWLQRYKADRKTLATEEDALPVRGYVEVVLDGFTA
ncbi:DUF6932 family protein [Arthrobacter silvisoli]|uniref:DUF6932 family protein n=1 Tax=Arthrobacter silvisoli TaxID=2291022 RepID=UPI000E215B07|nr:hypothetical protein [Arthrobacter silvisoli]